MSDRNHYGREWPDFGRRRRDSGGERRSEWDDTPEEPLSEEDAELASGELATEEALEHIEQRLDWFKFDPDLSGLVMWPPRLPLWQDPSSKPWGHRPHPGRDDSLPEEEQT